MRALPPGPPPTLSNDRRLHGTALRGLSCAARILERQVDLPLLAPLTSHEVIVNTIGTTTTSAGLTVQAELDTSIYPKGIKIPDREMKELEKTRITRDPWHGEWNYQIRPDATAKITAGPARNLDSG